MLSHEFIRNALLIGTAIAVSSGLVGYFLVLRAQVFAGDALGGVAFTGALAAAAAGLNLTLGLLIATVTVALLIALLGGRAPTDEVTIGVVLSWVLGLGVLFLDLFNAGQVGAGGGVLAARALFGSIFGLSASEARVGAALALAVAIAILAIGRPLLFASVDPRVARVAGVPVRLLGVVFLVLLGVDAAVAAKAIGAVLLLGLLAAPAGAARRLTASPRVGVALSVGIAVACMWLGIALSYEVAVLPPGSTVVLLAALAYLAASLVAFLRGRAGGGARRGAGIASAGALGAGALRGAVRHDGARPDGAGGGAIEGRAG